MNRRILSLVGVVAVAVAAGSAAPVWAEEEVDLFERAPWSLSLGPGYVNFEGDYPVEDSYFGILRLGYDFNPHWAVEGIAAYFPSLDPQDFADPRRIEVTDDIWGFKIGAEALYHLRNTRNLRVDPYLAAGVALYQ
jgi:hypothetical protein